MKILQIEHTDFGWMTKCEGLDKSIYTYKEPTWSVGEQLDKNNFEIPEGKKAYQLKKKDNATAAQSTKSQYQRPAYQPQDPLWTAVNGAYMQPEVLAKLTDKEFELYLERARRVYIHKGETKALVSVARNG